MKKTKLRPLRCGDKIYNQYVGFCIAVGVRRDGSVLLPNGNLSDASYVRLATPEEIARYFVT